MQRLRDGRQQIGSLPEWIRRVRELGLQRIALLGKTFCMLLAAKIALQWLPVDKVLAWKSGGILQPKKPSQDDRAERHRIRWALLAVSRRSPILFVCFPQSLVARLLLRARGIESKLYYGVTRKEGSLMTHTWVEADGEIIVGGEVADQFSVLAVY